MKQYDTPSSAEATSVLSDQQLNDMLHDLDSEANVRFQLHRNRIGIISVIRRNHVYAQKLTFRRNTNGAPVEQRTLRAHLSFPPHHPLGATLRHRRHPCRSLGAAVLLFLNTDIIFPVWLLQAALRRVVGLTCPRTASRDSEALVL